MYKIVVQLFILEIHYVCTIFTILLTLWNSEQKNGLLIKLSVFHPILMKLGEIVIHMGNYNFTKFYQNQMKNKKVLLIVHFSVQNFKVSVELWKSYIVGPSRTSPLIWTQQQLWNSNVFIRKFCQRLCMENCSV